MFSIFTHIRRLVAALFRGRCAPFNPDALEVREWADLPSYHEVSAKAPC